MGGETAVGPLIASLEDSELVVRRAALGALALGLEQIDRKLLSRDLDGLRPFLDPRQPIPEAFAQQAASELGLPPDEVEARYGALAERFGLRLAWRSDQ